MGSFREIAEKMDNVDTATSLRQLLDMHRFAPSEEQSFRLICDRHNNLRRIDRRFLFQNTFLMDLWFQREKNSTSNKPAVSDRATNIGRIIRDNFNIALLCEIFEDNVKDKVLEAWPNSSRPSVQEDAWKRTNGSSGLVTISQLDTLLPKQFHEYGHEDGWDARADKGIMRTEIDFGLGDSHLELYSTHLQAGSDSDKTRDRRKQVFELVQFIEQTHLTNNVALLAGDFNLGPFSEPNSREDLQNILSRDGGLAGMNRGYVDFLRTTASTDSYRDDGMSDYDMLNELMMHIGFKNIWEERNPTPGYTSGMEKKGPDGSIAEQICRADSTNPLFCDDINVPGNSEEFIDLYASERGIYGRSFLTDLFGDGIPPYDKSDRIDHIYLSNPVDGQTFSLDFTRPRRVRLERRPDAPERDKIVFLSDHLGLTTTFIISPSLD